MTGQRQRVARRRQSEARAYRITPTYTEGRSREEAIRTLLRAHL
jgi:hypothetical protein